MLSRKSNLLPILFLLRNETFSEVKPDFDQGHWYDSNLLWLKSTGPSCFQILILSITNLGIGKCGSHNRWLFYPSTTMSSLH